MVANLKVEMNVKFTDEPINRPTNQPTYIYQLANKRNERRTNNSLPALLIVDVVVIYSSTFRTIAAVCPIPNLCEMCAKLYFGNCLEKGRELSGGLPFLFATHLQLPSNTVRACVCVRARVRTLTMNKNIKSFLFFRPSVFRAFRANVYNVQIYLYRSSSSSINFMNGTWRDSKWDQVSLSQCVFGCPCYVYCIVSYVCRFFSTSLFWSRNANK